MRVNVTGHIYDLVAKARKSFKDTKDSHNKAVNAGEEIINSRYRGHSEEIQAMVANGFLKVTDSHIYILLS